MSADRDEKLDALLHSRRMETASPDLAQRIILRAQELPQRKSFPLWQWLSELCFEFHLPKPAYVVATALVLGLAIGFSVPPEKPAAASDNLSASAQSVFSADEALL